MIDDQVADALRNLLEHADSRVGIVTGSDLPYVIQQLGRWCDILGQAGLEIYPCNGTKYYRFFKGEWCLYDKLIEMRDVLTREDWRKLITTLHNAQLRIMKENADLPLTGNFISYRGTILNWCPIGRDAQRDDREKFESMDAEHQIRRRAMDWLVDCFQILFDNKLKVVLGGSTSFDIYVRGWDKTYVLSRLSGYDCWFVGDRVRDDGNDRTIYEAVGPHRGFETFGPSHTVTIIQELMNRLEKKKC